ncbi:RmlC-like cupin domain-containing protein [Achaetomium macrosporum]|uniref:RmlC-like cupin domain-containing protein n=1 Tax=Achaetomium macrosporum TaxID=79813 RepID=A0AAN7C9K7_9PEZI|nr:RmlC-like cupin domain-containing protein [Achaetomium macrosporum]
MLRIHNVFLPLLGMCMLLGSIPDTLATATTHHPTPINKRTAQEIITQLNLIPNVEGGYYIESFRDTTNVTFTATNPTNTTSIVTTRSASTEIYYLLEGSVGYSRWHRVDAVEVWHYYAGAPLTLSLARDDGSPVREVTLGPDVFAGQRPQVAIATWEWQRARSCGEWTLVGTTVAPGFDPNGVELADPDWMPNA